MDHCAAFRGCLYISEGHHFPASPGATMPPSQACGGGRQVQEVSVGRPLLPAGREGRSREVRCQPCCSTCLRDRTTARGGRSREACPDQVHLPLWPTPTGPCGECRALRQTSPAAPAPSPPASSVPLLGKKDYSLLPAGAWFLPFPVLLVTLWLPAWCLGAGKRHLVAVDAPSLDPVLSPQPGGNLAVERGRAPQQLSCVPQ